MPIVNVIDRRTCPFRYFKVTASLQAAWVTNGVFGADQSPWQGTAVDRDRHLSVEEAIAWANTVPGNVLLILYDFDEGKSNEYAD